MALIDDDVHFPASELFLTARGGAIVTTRHWPRTDPPENLADFYGSGYGRARSDTDDSFSLGDAFQPFQRLAPTIAKNDEIPPGSSALRLTTCCIPSIKELPSLQGRATIASKNSPAPCRRRIQGIASAVATLQTDLQLFAEAMLLCPTAHRPRQAHPRRRRRRQTVRSDHPTLIVKRRH